METQTLETELVHLRCHVDISQRDALAVANSSWIGPHRRWDVTRNIDQAR